MSAAVNGDRAVRLTIPAKAEYISLGRLAPQETVADLKLALTEACSNAIRHAYPNGEGRVHIVYDLQPDRLVIEVVDDGEGFDPERASDDADGLVEGGLGIAIIRAIADELEIGVGDRGRGSRLRFVKLLAG
jgi:serine/threonine-protein kinase RsbW